jgi:hypothetical protein
MKVQYVVAALAAAAAIPSSAEAITFVHYAQRAHQICGQDVNPSRHWLGVAETAFRSGNVASFTRAWLELSRIDSRTATRLALLPKPSSGNLTLLDELIPARRQVSRDELALSEIWPGRRWTAARFLAAESAFVSDQNHSNRIGYRLGFC